MFNSTDIQTIIYLFAGAAFVLLVYIARELFKITKQEDENSDWVIDFCAGKPYRKIK